MRSRRRVVGILVDKLKLELELGLGGTGRLVSFGLRKGKMALAWLVALSLAGLNIRSQA